LKGTVSVVIREDDICYFTKPEVLEHIYGQLLNSSMPINLAVIPMVDCRLNRPFISPHYRGRNLRISIEENKDLIEFVKQHDLEVLQHGLTHEFFGPRFTPEFKINDRAEVARRAKLGMQVLQRAFRRIPRFFVPPWDVLSPQAYKVLSKYYDGILLAFTSQSRRCVFDKFLDLIPRHLPLSYIPEFFLSRLKNRNYFVVNGCLILEHKGLAISPEIEEEHFFHLFKETAKKWRVIVVVNHHWYLLSNHKLMSIWLKFMDFLLRDGRVKIVTASNGYKILAK